MCKPCMFSHGAGVLQTGAAERAENRVNGAAGAVSCEAQLLRSTPLVPSLQERVVETLLATSPSPPFPTLPAETLQATSPRRAVELISGWFRSWRISSHFITEHNRFGDFPHRPALLPALPLQRQVSLFFGQPQIALQDAFGALHYFARLQLLRQVDIRILQPRHLDFGAYQKSDRRNQTNFPPPVNMMLAMLQVDHSHHAAAGHQGHRQKRLVAILGQFVEELKARIQCRL